MSAPLFQEENQPSRGAPDWQSLDPQSRLFQNLLDPLGINPEFWSALQTHGLAEITAKLAEAYRDDARPQVDELRVGLATLTDEMLGLIGRNPPPVMFSDSDFVARHGLPLAGSRLVGIRRGVSVESGMEFHISIAGREKELCWRHGSAVLAGGVLREVDRSQHELVFMPNWFPSYQGPGQYRVVYLVKRGGQLSQLFKSLWTELLPCLEEGCA